jgi:hypothetical protein
MQFRIGFSFLRVPGIMQVQPYMQLALSYDVKQVIQSIYLRFVKKFGKGNGKVKSKLAEHRKRVKKCNKCVKSGKAFCDRRKSADAMLKSGFNKETMDECMNLNLESMDDCKAFKWPLEATNTSDMVSMFGNYVCPCFDGFHGGVIHPDWITSKARCDEMALPGREDEKSRRTQKRTDFQLGFKQGSRLRLGNSFSYPEKAGCRQKFKCCVAYKPDGSEISRCLDHQYIKSAFHKAKCKYFKPKDIKVKKGDWSHQGQWFRCSAKYESFDGHWTKVNKFWQNVESVEA